jgi:hypothetical protein
VSDKAPFRREPWHEGPDAGAPPESWLSLDDDEVLQRIETLDPAVDADDRLLEIVHSSRHFFIRQEAAKRVRDRRRLFAFESDRHVGQILVRHLTRREDIDYLEKLAGRSHHVEVRKAAQLQLARLWARFQPSAPGQGQVPPAGRLAARAPERESSRGGAVEANLLGWAVHSIVEPARSRLGAELTASLLHRSQQELREAHPVLGRFKLDASAQVALELAGSAKLGPQAVRGVAAWMASFLAAAGREDRELGRISVREVTRLMADALQEAGFYSAHEEAARRRSG